MPDSPGYRLTYPGKGTLIHSRGFRRALLGPVRRARRGGRRPHQVSADLVKAVIAVESEFDQWAVSSKGARGLMQLMPATARRFGVSDAFDARQNILAGTQYLRILLDLFPGDVSLALAAYNAGENAVLRYGGIPPYHETRGYVAKVQALLGGFVPAVSPAAALGARPLPSSPLRSRCGRQRRRSGRARPQPPARAGAPADLLSLARRRRRHARRRGAAARRHGVPDRARPRLMSDPIPRGPFDQGLFLTHFNKGRDLYDARRFDEAERQLEEAYLLRPRDARVLNLLGLVYFRGEQAGSRPRRSTASWSPRTRDAPTLFYNLGLICFKLNRLDDAEQAFRKALDLTEGNPKIHFYLGSIYERLQRYKDAIYQYRQAGANLMVQRVQGKLETAERKGGDDPGPRRTLARGGRRARAR